MRKLILSFVAILFLIMYCNSLQAQKYDMSIKEIRSHVQNISASIKKQENSIDNMYIHVNNEGVRYLFIENTNIDGLRSDEGYISFELSKVIVKMIFKSINYNLEEPLSFYSYKKLLESKSIQGVEFKTKNNTFIYDWDKFNNANN